MMQLNIFGDFENIRLSKKPSATPSSGDLENIRLFPDATPTKEKPLENGVLKTFANCSPADQNALENAIAKPIARRSDPRPSHLAAQAITASGAREGQLKGVLALLRKYPRSTSLELFSKSNYADRYVPARRLSELERAGLARKCGERLCTIGDRMATIWEAVELTPKR